MPTPTVRDVYVDAPLTAISIKYKHPTLIAKQIFPEVRVMKDSGLYFIYGKQDFRIFNTVRAPGSRAKQVEWTIEKSPTYFLKEHALEMQLIDEVRDNVADPIKYDTDSTEYLTAMLELDFEYDVANLLQNPDSYAPGHSETLTGTMKWSDYVNSNPIKKVRAMKTTIKKKIFLKPNVMIVSEDVHNVLLDHPMIIDRTKYAQIGIVTEDLLARFFEIDRYLIGESAYISSPEGKPEVFSDIWNNCVILLYVTPTPGLKQLSFGYDFRREGYRMVERWREEPLKSDWIRVSDKHDPFIVCPSAGYLLKGVI